MRSVAGPGETPWARCQARGNRLGCTSSRAARAAPLPHVVPLPAPQVRPAFPHHHAFIYIVVTFTPTHGAAIRRGGGLAGARAWMGVPAQQQTDGTAREGGHSCCQLLEGPEGHSKARSGQGRAVARREANGGCGVWRERGARRRHAVNTAGWVDTAGRVKKRFGPRAGARVVLQDRCWGRVRVQAKREEAGKRETASYRYLGAIRGGQHRSAESESESEREEERATHQSVRR